MEPKQSNSRRHGTLFLIPSPLGASDPRRILPPDSLEPLRQIRDFVVENEKTAWRVLTRLFTQAELDESRMTILNEHTPVSEVEALLGPALEGRPIGLLSEAGCPGVADPGAPLVGAAHRLGVPVMPLIGPSSLLLALMASGMNGQAFRFCGYLPRERAERVRTIRALERRALESGETQIFIETPYRNDHMLADMLECLKPATRICIAVDMSLETQNVMSGEVARIAASKPEIGKRPAVFLIGAPG